MVAHPNPRTDESLERTIEALLAEEQYLGHPLRDALAHLWTSTRERLSKLERITQISDRYQNMAQEQARTVSERYSRQLRQIEKIIRISDRYQGMLQDLNAALRDASTHDPLTGLANRRLLVERMRQEDARAGREHRPYALAVIDADHFKRINDSFGHEAGDQVLIALAQSLKAGLRESDLCGRWGGEEFLILLAEANAQAALAAIERILRDVRLLRMPWDGTELPVTVSAGLAVNQSGESYQDTLRRADEALLVAKRGGRDRCCVAASRNEDPALV
jgi:diguanylate cyclase (GGDEF)-like protein